ncbi:MAG: chemotaxis response regulator protein-glutamate methylesterase [Spirochaetia bacterium]|nr:chemotaxis response regulator protein-glutamate methylesterase [Spirochaetia bacterium]
MPKINVLIVDDSAVVRSVLSDILSKDPAIHVYATASDPIFAQRHMEKQWPDVIILDIEMPRMDGVTFLKKIMSERPTPVVICSTLSKEGAEVTFEAINAGAIAIITKPEMGLKGFLEESRITFVDAVKSAAKAQINKIKTILIKPLETSKLSDSKPLASKQLQKSAENKISEKLTADAVLEKGTGRAMAVTTDKVIAIGASAGGTQTLEILLQMVSKTAHGIVIVQHMPEGFTAAFSARLNSVCNIEVKEAEDGDRIIPGRAIIAHGNKHMTVIRSGAQYQVKVLDGPLVSRHRPSVDVLFRSVAKEVGKNALGIILTGMGDDGANGLLEMREAGAHTVAQDEDTSIVYGMPFEAFKRGAAVEQASLYEIPKIINQFN